MKAWVTLLAVAGCVVWPLSGSAVADTACDLYAAPSGSDTGAGTIAAPFQTTQKLADSLSPGQTGCLLAGTYHEDVRIGHGGQAGAPVTLTSYPGQSATIVGRFWIARGSDYVTISGLHLDGVNADGLPSPTVNANDATFTGDDVTDDRTGICFLIGSRPWGTAANTLITRSRIHDCGELPATNYDHGIYVEAATDTRIEWNLIYDNADRGIQLYPDAVHTTVDHNVIDGNGEGIIFSGDNGYASSYSNVYDNLLTNARIRHDAESWWPDGNPVGTGNVLHDNCVWGAQGAPIDTSGGGFTVYRNLVARPRYVNLAKHDYRLAPTSRCLGFTGDVEAVVDGTARTVPATARRVARPRLEARRARLARSHARARRRACRRLALALRERRARAGRARRAELSDRGSSRACAGVPRRPRRRAGTHVRGSARPHG